MENINSNLFFFTPEHEIDEEAFQNMSDDIIKEVIPVIGKRIKFMQKYKLYKTAALSDTHLSDDASTASTSTIVGEEVNSSHHSQESSFQNVYTQCKRNYPFYGEENLKRAFRATYQLDLESFLKQTSPGRQILHSYNNENRLSQKQRNLLVDVLIKEAINDTGK